jgi:hypothetical protein
MSSTGMREHSKQCATANGCICGRDKQYDRAGLGCDEGVMMQEYRVLGHNGADANCKEQG